jgi:hypothetical protein
MSGGPWAIDAPTLRRGGRASAVRRWLLLAAGLLLTTDDILEDGFAVGAAVVAVEVAGPVVEAALDELGD